jgi:hypothetical protein
MKAKWMLCGGVMLTPLALAATGAFGAKTALANPPVAATVTATVTATARPTALPIDPPVTIAFDNVPSGTAVDTAYQPGATFSVVVSGPNGGLQATVSHVYASADPSIVRVPCALGLPCPTPGGNVVTLSAPGQSPWFEGGSGGIKVAFSTPKAWVSVAVRASAMPGSTIGSNAQITNEPYMLAYGPNGYLGEAVDSWPATDPRWGQFTTITYPAPAGQTITFVVLSTQQRSGPHVMAEFDSLSYPK